MWEARIIDAVIPRFPILIRVVVVLAGHVAAQTRNAEPDPLVRMFDSWTTLHPAAGPITIENCVVVGNDGRFHLELRRQEFMDDRATLNIYEGVLNNKSIQILKNLLDADAIRKLPTSKSPKFPLLQEDWLEGFRAEISRGQDTQDVGYYVFKPEGPDNPDSVVKGWQESQTALQPLVEWFRALKTYKDPAKRLVSNSKSTLCERAP